MINRPILTLYGRTYCHLCDDMLAALESQRDKHDFSVEVVDVDTRPELVERFNELVPVLMLDDKEICHYFLDVERLRIALNQAKVD